MPVLNDPNDATFQQWATRHQWFPVIREIEYGERDADENDEANRPPIPDALNYLLLLPGPLYFAFSDCECSLVYIKNDGTYGATIWDVTGEDDLPWAVFLVDDFGPRLLAEYSLLEEEADPESLDALLLRATEELPDRLVSGEFDRFGDPVPIPDALNVPPIEYVEEQ